MNRYRLAESEAFEGNEPFVAFIGQGCLDTGAKVELLVAKELVELEARGYAQACLEGKLVFDFSKKEFSGKISIPPIVLNAKFIVKSKGILEFDLVNWDGSLSVTNEWLIYDGS